MEAKLNNDFLPNKEKLVKVTTELAEKTKATRYLEAELANLKRQIEIKNKIMYAIHLVLIFTS